MHVRAQVVAETWICDQLSCLLFSCFCQSTTRGEGVILWLKWFERRNNKNPKLQTLHRDTMVTVQACPDCPGVANETVPFLVPMS